MTTTLVLNPGVGGEDLAVEENSVSGAQYQAIANLGTLYVSAGDLTGLSSNHKFGARYDVDTGDGPIAVWDGASNWVAPTASRVHAIVSTAVADTNTAGTGMRTLVVQGLDTNFDMQSETVILNGQTPVNTGSAYTRIFRMYGATFGSGAQNAGTITATAAAPDSTLTAVIAVEPTSGIGLSQTMMAVYTVPNDKEAFLYGVHISLTRFNSTPATAATHGLFRLKARPNADTATAGWLTKSFMGASVSGSSAPDYVRHGVPVMFDEKTDLVIEVIDVSEDNCGVTASFDLIVRDK